MPANVWVLAGCQALAMCSVPMMVLVSGLLSARIAPDEKLATLPVALVVVGTACSAVPAAMINRRFGRKRGGYFGFAAGLVACALGYIAAKEAVFPLLLAASLCMGAAVAFGQQFRFAALESVSDPSNYGPAISAFMTGGLVAAVLGPEIGAFGRDLIESPHGFAGSFAVQGGVILAAVLLYSLYHETPQSASLSEPRGRPMKEIVRSPAFMVAAGTAAVSYIVMSFIMTATPINMYELCGFTLTDTKRVIQSHILAMFLPSLFSGWLMKRYGARKLMIAGVVAYAVVVVVGTQGQRLVHFWAALVVLGVGWNFLFASGTALLPLSYQPSERFRAQAANDLCVFGSQAVASLSAGWFLFSFGWSAMLFSCAPLLLVAGVLIGRSRSLRTAS
ncbi:MFS transporter [Pelagicoccus sp. SDUM812003]|uniref:MFS transporter n=1 Tax=Pelagicoccus sp. SDUM812003 TaxID=3041267 RepID=UPI002812636C|nr:MFS transporter [Pelagicoccus sp. SDUM812003]